MSRVEYSGPTEYLAPGDVPQEYQGVVRDTENRVRVAVDSGRPLERIWSDGGDMTVYRQGVEPDVGPTKPVVEFGAGETVGEVADRASASIVDRVNDELPADSPDFGVVSELDGVTSVGVRDAGPVERIESINLHEYAALVSESWFSGPSAESVAAAQARIETGEFTAPADDEQGERGAEDRREVREMAEEVADDEPGVEFADAAAVVEKAAAEQGVDEIRSNLSGGDIDRRKAAGGAVIALVLLALLARAD